MEIKGMFEIIWTKKGFKSLKKIDHTARMYISASVDSLKKWPKVKNVKALTNHQYEYRLRVRDYRVFFSVQENIEIVKIEKVSKRDERTY